MNGGHENLGGRPPENQPRREIGKNDVVAYLHAHHREPGWEDAGGLAVWIEKNDHHLESALPYFENACARSYLLENTELKELRSYVHFLDRVARVQRDLPKTTIVSILRKHADSVRVHARIRMEDRKDVDEMAEEWGADIARYEQYDDIDGVLSRMETMVRDLNATIDSKMRSQPPSVKEHLKNEAEIENLKKLLGKWRAARGTLLERYFAPDSMH